MAWHGGPELASGIARIKGVGSHGVRVGNWLSLRQAQLLLNAPDVTTKKGLSDRAMFATLLGCGLRRSELANLRMKHVQQRDNRWCTVDLAGKHARARTIPMPARAGTGAHSVAARPFSGADDGEVSRNEAGSGDARDTLRSRSRNARTNSPDLSPPYKNKTRHSA